MTICCNGRNVKWNKDKTICMNKATNFLRYKWGETEEYFCFCDVHDHVRGFPVTILTEDFWSISIVMSS